MALSIVEAVNLAQGALLPDRRRDRITSELSGKPCFIEPRLPSTAERPPSELGWNHDIKLDEN